MINKIGQFMKIKQRKEKQKKTYLLMTHEVILSRTKQINEKL